MVREIDRDIKPNLNKTAIGSEQNENTPDKGGGLSVIN